MFIFAHFGHHLMTALPGALLPFIRDDHSLSSKGLSNAEVAWVTTAFSLSYGLGQLPGGWLADRIGRKVMIAIGIFGVAIGYSDWAFHDLHPSSGFVSVNGSTWWRLSSFCHALDFQFGR